MFIFSFYKPIHKNKLDLTGAGQKLKRKFKKLKRKSTISKKVGFLFVSFLNFNAKGEVKNL
ncbi:hypothetical protein A7Q10_01735 [Methylacidiphilum caldifontis]|uniref:Uncharacterized protein n=1 Tax=Methylacidiphilum caldifontis TaxID=2795386 RepID=A0A4Y8P9B6_9BACT|nr:hypothetical protein A7Q10_01735 [Methylacidiphilum caldifontis]